MSRGPEEGPAPRRGLPPWARPTVVTTRVLQALAAALALSTFVAGLHDVSRAWDVWYYHLPFAARLAGLVGPDAYVFHATNWSRLTGFPVFAELLQGIFWRLTGRPEGANLLCMASLALFVAFLRRAFRVPLHLAFLALMAVPLVQIHVTSAYIDLPANAFAAALVLSVFRLYVDEDPPAARAGLWILLLSTVVANMRFQLHPLVALSVAAALPRLLPPLWRARAFPTLGLFALFVPLVGATFLKNAVVHHNPYYPMALSVGGLVLPGPDTPYSSSPEWLAHAPSAFRWLCSVLEVGVRPLVDGRRWTIDQWAPSDSPALRMGGFFGAYVVFLVGLLVWQVARERNRRGRVVGIGFALFTLAMAHLPQSHELRYYLCWMMVLVSLNLWMVSARDREEEAEVEPSAEQGIENPRVVGSWRTAGLGMACTGFLAVVLGVTNAGYVYPSGTTFAELLREKVDRAVVEGSVEGETLCLRRDPYTFLYASRFHPERRYVVREVEDDEDCGAARWVP